MKSNGEHRRSSVSSAEEYEGSALCKDYITFDDVLKSVRGFGPFQWRMYIFVSLLEIPCSIGILLFVFIGADPGWRCSALGSTTSVNRSVSFPNVSSGLDTHDMCSWNSSVCPQHVYDTQFTSIVSEWDLVCSRQYIRTVITTFLMAGVGIGAGIAGQLADVFGRRHVLYGIATFAMALLLLQSFAVNWQMLLATRFLLGISCGAVMVVGAVLPLEVVSMHWRVLCCVVGGWQFGILLLGVVAYFVHDWRHLCMTVSFLCLPMIIGWYFVPESPRWLIQHGRYEEAHAITTKMAQMNNRKPPDLETLKRVAIGDDTKHSKKKYSYKDLFRTKSLARNTLVLLWMWFGCSIVYYGIALNLRDVNINRSANLMVMGVLDFGANTSVIWTSRRFGRKPSLMGYLTVATLSIITIAVCDNVINFDEFPELRMAVALVGRAAISASWVGGYLLTAELFPTVVRNLSAAICSISARVGGVLAPQVAYLSFVHPSVPYIVYAILAVTSALLLLLVPETNGLPLPDAMPSVRVAIGHVDNKDITPESTHLQDNKQVNKDTVVTELVEKA